MPVIPADGFFGFFTLPPAYCAKAACAPPMSGLVAEAERPLAVGHDRDPDLPGRRIRRRERRRDGHRGSDREHAEREHELPSPLETAHTPFPPWLCVVLPSCWTCLHTLRPIPPLVSLAGRISPPGSPDPPRGRRTVLHARSQRPDQPVGRENDDEQEDDPDDGVEAAADLDRVEELGQPAVADVVVDDDEGERADPGALDPPEPADHRDDQQVDRRAEADVARSDLSLPPDEQDPASDARNAAKPNASVRWSGTM